MKARSAFVLGLGSGILSAALELMRRTLDPLSSALPHVTVRHTKLGPTDEAEKKYLSTSVNDLVLAEPMSFDTGGGQGKELRTLVFRCESLTLEALVYKPDFFETVTHCTIYDGPPSRLAHEAYDRLSDMEWDLRFPRDLRIQPYSGRPRERRLSPQASLLASQVMGKESFSLRSLDSLNDEKRLELLSELAQVMRSETARTRASLHKGAGAEAAPGRQTIRVAPKSVFQPALFNFGETAGFLASIGPDARHVRKRSGDIPTPPEIASQLVHHLNAMRGPLRQPIQFGDPALGAGVFFAQTALLHGEPITSATGVEVNALRADRTAYFYRNSGLRVITADFILLPPESQSWNFVAANPPYLRAAKVPSNARQLAPIFAKELNVYLDGKADYYMYFMLATHLWLARGAFSVWLIPSEFTTTQSGEALRRYLSTKVRCRQIHFFDASAGSIFQDVMVTSCAVFFENVAPSGGDLVRFSSGMEVNRPASNAFVSVDSLRSRNKWSMQSLLAKPTESTRDDQTPLSSLVNVRRGIATGANEDFLLKHDDVRELDPQGLYTKRVLPRAHRLPANGIVTTDYLNESQSLLDGRWLIDTSDSLDVVAERAPSLAAYLRRIERKVMSSALVRRRSPFYRQDRQGQVQFFFSYMSKPKNVEGNTRFFLNQSGAVALNNYLVLQPSPIFGTWLTDHRRNSAQFLETLRAVPESELARRGTHYATGLLKLEPRDVREVVIRDPRGPVA